MANRISKSGKKFASSHSSYTEMANNLVSFLETTDGINKISAGIIKTNLSNLKGSKRIKLLDQGSCVLLRIRDNISLQEVRLYGDNQTITQLVVKYSEENNILLDGIE
ncbi:MAG: hypothetical protein ACKKL4_01515 [Patescibacteria group bacterium]